MKDYTSEGMYIGEGSLSYAYHGRGAFVYKDGCLYIGNWSYSIKDGMGTDYYSYGDKYVEEFYTNQKHGKGKIFLCNGVIYEGNFWLDKCMEKVFLLILENLKSM